MSLVRLNSSDDLDFGRVKRPAQLGHILKNVAVNLCFSSIIKELFDRISRHFRSLQNLAFEVLKSSSELFLFLVRA